REAVDQQQMLLELAAVDGHGNQRERVRAPDILAASRHARNQDAERDVTASGGNHIHDILRHDALAKRVLHVDDGRLAGYGDGFFDGADTQLGVQRRRERSGQLDPFTLRRAEARQRESDDISARPEIDDSILTGGIRDDGTDFLDQDGTRGFDRDARQDG